MKYHDHPEFQKIFEAMSALDVLTPSARVLVMMEFCMQCGSDKDCDCSQHLADEHDRYLDYAVAY